MKAKADKAEKKKKAKDSDNEEEKEENEGEKEKRKSEKKVVKKVEEEEVSEEIKVLFSAEYSALMWNGSDLEDKIWFLQGCLIIMLRIQFFHLFDTY